MRQDVVIKRLGGAESYVRECIEGTCIVDMGKKAQADYVAKASVGKLENTGASSRTNATKTYPLTT